MKRLLIALALAISMSFGISAQALAATDRYWDVQIMTPAASSSDHTLNVAYNVLSTVADDVYDVTLYQNEVSVGTQHVDHGKGGNSGVFNLTLPTNGTYNYQISANNTSAGGEVKTTDVKSVTIVNGPTPIVTTINTASSQAATAAGSAGSAGEGNTGSNDNGTGAGQTNSSNGTGSVSDKAATTNKAGSALGASTTKAKTSDKKWYFIGAAILILGGAAYYWFIYRAAGELE